MTEQQEASSGEKQRENCAGVDFLSHSCCVCSKPFTPRQHNQVTCGALGCRWGRLKKAVRAAEHKEFVERGWARRRAKSAPELTGDRRGPQARDKFKDAERFVTDKQQRFSRCTNCGTEFQDGQGRPTPSSFQFCGETILVNGVCKAAWLAARPTPKPVQVKSVVSDKLVEKRIAKTKRVHAPRIGKMPRKMLNFCPLCKEYVKQDHEHVI